MANNSRSNGGRHGSLRSMATGGGGCSSSGCNRGTLEPVVRMLMECGADAMEHGYGAWKAEERRKVAVGRDVLDDVPS